MSNQPKPVEWTNYRCICCVGDTGSGKTATCFKILEKITNKDKYIYKYPTPEILDEFDIYNLDQLNFDELIDCAFYIDEPQLSVVSPNDKTGLIRLLSLARQRDILVLMSTSDTRWITKSLESYIDCWIIKDLDYKTVKQGSLIKQIINEHYHNIMPQTFKLDNNKAIFYARKTHGQPIMLDIALPKNWSMEVSKPYKFKSINETTNVRLDM